MRTDGYQSVAFEPPALVTVVCDWNTPARTRQALRQEGFAYRQYGPWRRCRGIDKGGEKEPDARCVGDVMFFPILTVAPCVERGSLRFNQCYLGRKPDNLD
jgi:hypothetical protein